MLKNKMDTLLDKATALLDRGHYDEGLAILQEIVASNPDDPVLHKLLGVAYNKNGCHAEALRHLSTALELNPLDNETLTHHAIVLTNMLRMSDAEACILRALAINPANALAYNNLGRVCRFQGRAVEAVEAFRKALELEPHNSVVLNNLLLALNYHPDISPEEVFSEHQRLCEQVYKVAGELPPRTEIRVSDRIRVGYVSGDFHNHSVSFFFEPILRHHDDGRFTIYCYSNDNRVDETTRRLKSMNSVWRDIEGLPDERVAEMVREDGISILVDLSGHSSGNRLGLFALKPAPVQVSWLGYPHSTGLRQMDYFLTDALCDPPGLTDQLYTEKLVRLPGSFCCYLPPVDFPAVSPPPSTASGIVTFGSFNNFAKANDLLIEIWSKLLLRVPGSRLFLKSMSLGDRTVQQSVLAHFRGCGIFEDRIALLSTVNSPLDHLALYSQIDIALDTYPYHGTTTTCEALWMGVPVVTLIGRCHAARVGVSLLSSARLETLIAGSPEEYVDIAVKLANDNELRARMRDNLRLIIATSPLMDAVSVTREVESAYIQICEIQCCSHL